MQLNSIDPNHSIENELGMDADQIRRRKAFLELTDEDVVCLKELHTRLQEHGDEFANVFYNAILSFPELRALIPDADVLDRLKQKQAIYFNELTAGNYDEAYIHQRLQIGITHQRIGLALQWYLGSYRKYLSHFLTLLSELFGGDSEKFIATYNALLKIVMFDMGLAVDTYGYADKQTILRLEHNLSNLVEGIDAIIWQADLASRQCSYVSSQAEKLGYPLTRWRAETDFRSTLIVPEDREAIIAFTTQEIAAGRDHNMEYRIQTADGRIIWIHEKVTLAEKLGFLRGVMVDITAIKETEQQLIHHASHDDLTGLPNRNLLQDRMKQALAHADRYGTMLAILFIDLDRFKNINDSLGHDIGDLVLQTTTERLTGCVREADTVARLGGDEFVVMLLDINGSENVTLVAQKILDSLAAPFMIAGHKFFLGASMGICIYPKNGTDPQILLKNADVAMYRAKDNGKNCFVFYTDEMNATAAYRLRIENQLRLALERQEFVLHYQPQADLESGRIFGVEALVRWQNPEMGLVSPVEFIQIAEETGLIVPLGEWVLETACRQAVAWQAAGLPKLKMAVNLSARQFMQHDLADTVANILHKTGLDPKLLELELTESILMKGVAESIAALRTLRKMGISLSVDDFGTGYSSLSYLSRFPVTAVKIDQSFVRDIAIDPNAAGLVRTIISMAHELRLKVIAEGVETEGQLSFIVGYRCDEMQGYYLSKPLTAEAVAEMLLNHPGLPLRHGATDIQERTLLLVDDEANILSALKRQLRGEGYRIFTATSGNEALELLAIHDIGVIISDQRMPEMTGIELLHRVKDLYPATVRIILSGYSDIQSVTDAINQGAIYKYLNKPWEDETLRETIREAFQRYELRQENARLGRALERANIELSDINRDLEIRVAEKTQEINRNVNMLQISQEILEHLPTAVLGIDDDGLIVMANQQANLLFGGDGGGPLVSCDAAERLPQALIDVLASGADSQPVVSLVDGRNLRVISYRMSERCRSQGTVLTILPIDTIGENHPASLLAQP